MIVLSAVRIVVAAVGVILLAGCVTRDTASPARPAPTSAPSRPALPAVIARACGHPGATVELPSVPITIAHRDCDLTGVGLSYKNYGGAYVHDRGGEIGVSLGFHLVVDAHGNVTVTVTGTPGIG